MQKKVVLILCSFSDEITVPELYQITSNAKINYISLCVLFHHVTVKIRFHFLLIRPRFLNSNRLWAKFVGICAELVQTKKKVKTFVF